MKTIPVCLIVVGMFLPAVCLAQPGGNRPEEPRRGRPDDRGPRQMMDFWKTVDKNQDGNLSKDEFDSMPRIMNLPEEKRASLFERLDKNSDGRLGREELGRLGGKHPEADEPPMRRLWELDVDKSGGISLDEFKAGSFFKKLPPDRQGVLFKRLDTDGDGIVSPRDKPEPPFKRSGDPKGPRPDGGRPSGGRPDGARPDGPRPDGGRPYGGRPDGARPGGDRPDPRQFFRQLDKDDDGFLSFNEFRQGPGVASLSEDEQEDRFEALDKDGDFKLVPGDFPSPSAQGDARRVPRPGAE